jgi:DNA-binding transcriptional MerR regulator
VAEAEFDLKALCERSRVTPRTVHFYVQQGLLPPAGTPGPGARYGEGHISRLKLIRLLQKQHLPLAEIARRMKGLSDAQVRTLVEETRARRASGRGSALDYIRSVLAEQPAIGSAAVMPSRVSAHRSTGLESGAPHHEPRLETAFAPSESRSQWERFTLTDGMELNVRRPLSRIQQRQLDRILNAAREIVGENDEE